MTDDTDHKVKMQQVQKEHRRKTSQAQDPDRGLVFVHTGKGKGKSSSAFGVIIRALGWGQKVAVVQFIKGKWVTGERRFFKRLKIRSVGIPWATALLGIRKIATAIPRPHRRRLQKPVR